MRKGLRKEEEEGKKKNEQFCNSQLAQTERAQTRTATIGKFGHDAIWHVQQDPLIISLKKNECVRAYGPSIGEPFKYIMTMSLPRHFCSSRPLVTLISPRSV